MSRSVEDVVEDFRKSSYVRPSRYGVVLDWGELESRINYYIQTEVLGQVRHAEALWWATAIKKQPISIAEANEHLAELGIAALERA